MLQNRAKQPGRPPQEMLQYFSMERFLYRLSKSEHASRLMLSHPATERGRRPKRIRIAPIREYPHRAANRQRQNTAPASFVLQSLQLCVELLPVFHAEQVGSLGVNPKVAGPNPGPATSLLSPIDFRPVGEERSARPACRPFFVSACILRAFHDAATTARSSFLAPFGLTHARFAQTIRIRKAFNKVKHGLFDSPTPKEGGFQVPILTPTTRKTAGQRQTEKTGTIPPV